MAAESTADSLLVSIASDEDILSARSQIRSMAQRAGFQPTEMVRIITAVSELARNMLIYAGRGELFASFVTENGRGGLLIEARDDGPGIPDLAKALMDGFSTSGGLGLGLPGARRLMDDFEIHSEVRKGTVVRVKKWLEEGAPGLPEVPPQHPPSPLVESGAAERTIPGETATGDRYVMRHFPGGVLFAVIDGLGHGPEAARAAQIAVEVLSASPSTDIVRLVRECHERLRHSRGVVLTVVSVNAASARATWIGVGNVQGMLAHMANGKESAGRAFTVLRSGIVGQRLPTLQPSVFAIEKGDTFVIATDGVSLDFMRERSLAEAPQVLADRIMERYSLGSDDALVLVVRFVGEGHAGSPGRSDR